MVVPHKTSINGKVLNFKTDWISVNSQNTGQFSAAAYYFAKELRKQLNVPIGLVECARGATRIQPWISQELQMVHRLLEFLILHSKNCQFLQRY